MTEFLPYLIFAFVILIWLRVEKVSKQVSELYEGIENLRRELGLKEQVPQGRSEKV